MSLPPSEVAYQLAHANDDGRSGLIISSAICLPAAYIAVLLRLTSRKISRGGLQADDYLILLGLVRSEFYGYDLKVTRR